MGSRLLDVDLVRSLRAGGLSLAALGERFGVSHVAISRICKGVACPVDHSAATKAAFAERIRQRRDALAAVRERARELRRAGYTLSAIGDALAISHVQVHAYVADTRRGPLRRGPVDAITSAVRLPTDVPRWASLAGLAEDYRDLRRELGEDHAARTCRRLKAEAQRPC